MKKYKEICVDGCINLVGGVIAQSVRDYQSKEFKKIDSWEWERIHRFLFKPGRLELFVKIFNLDGIVDLGYIRMKAKSRKRINLVNQKQGG